MALTDYVIMPGEDYKGICDTVRSKLNTTNLYTSKTLIDAIKSIEGGETVIFTPAPRKDINFLDYDGECLFSYTLEEITSLTELPTPSLIRDKNLIFSGWNWTLADIQAYGHPLDIGAIYEPEATLLYISIPKAGRLTVPIMFSQTASGDTTIDWGDGTETTTSGTSVSTSHTYATPGHYVIKLISNSGTITLGGSSSTYTVMGEYGDATRVYLNMLTQIVCGTNMTGFNNYACQYCENLRLVSLSNTVKSIGEQVFYYSGIECVTISSSITELPTRCFEGNNHLKTILLPSTITTMGNYIFRHDHSLNNIYLPSSLAKIPNNCFEGCYCLCGIYFPPSITAFGGNGFKNCFGIALCDFSNHTSIPTLSNTSTFSEMPSDCKIIVPANLYDTWIAATNWSGLADNIVAAEV